MKVDVSVTVSDFIKIQSKFTSKNNENLIKTYKKIARAIVSSTALDANTNFNEELGDFGPHLGPKNVCTVNKNVKLRTGGASGAPRASQ